MHGQILEPAVDHQPKDQAQDAEKNAEEQKFVAIDTHKLHLVRSGSLRAASHRLPRRLRESAHGGEQGSNSAATLNFENLQASAQAGVSQVRIKHSRQNKKDFEVNSVLCSVLSDTPVCLVIFAAPGGACQITTKPHFFDGTGT